MKTHSTRNLTGQVEVGRTGNPASTTWLGLLVRLWEYWGNTGETPPQCFTGVDTLGGYVGGILPRFTLGLFGELPGFVAGDRFSIVAVYLTTISILEGDFLPGESSRASRVEIEAAQWLQNTLWKGILWNVDPPSYSLHCIEKSFICLSLS